MSAGPYGSIKLGLAGYENARLEQSGAIQGADFLGNYFLSMSGGYSWNFFRLEAEGAFRFYDAENIDVDVVSSSSSDIGSESFTLMANGYIDFKFLPVYPYIMGGVGVAVVDIEGFAIDPSIPGMMWMLPLLINSEGESVYRPSMVLILFLSTGIHGQTT